jgi:hypothetical protein
MRTRERAASGGQGRPKAAPRGVALTGEGNWRATIVRQLNGVVPDGGHGG